jgi:nucleoside-diphosphate-sugar epimerase
VVAEKLLTRGHEVYGLARHAVEEAKLTERGVRPVRGDLQDGASLARGANEVDGVIHTAFIHDFSHYGGAVRTDRAANAAFLEALGGTDKPFVATSGSAFLGDTGDAPADEDYHADRNSPFYSRAEAEAEVLAMAGSGVRSAVVRLPLFVYGRGGSAFVPYLIKTAKDAGASRYVGEGDQKVSAVHVEDAAQVFVLALEKAAPGALFNVAAETTTNWDLAAAVAVLAGVKTESVPPAEAAKVFGPMTGFLTINNQLSAERVRRELNWRPRFEKGITRDIESGSYRASVAVNG